MIRSVDELRTRYPAPGERSIKKQLDALDFHCRRFLARSPFCVLATSDAEGHLDASPRGGEPGFIQVGDPKTLWIPDSVGNNRLDSLNNIVTHRGVGLLCLIPGVDETLRINGMATLHDEPDLIGRFDGERKPPRLVIQVQVQEVYLHCAKALMRSKLWHEDTRIERQELPTMGQMLKDQIGSDGPVESQEAMLERYGKDL